MIIFIDLFFAFRQYATIIIKPSPKANVEIIEVVNVELEVEIP